MFKSTQKFGLMPWHDLGWQLRTGARAAVLYNKDKKLTLGNLLSHEVQQAAAYNYANHCGQDISCR